MKVRREREIDYNKGILIFKKMRREREKRKTIKRERMKCLHNAKKRGNIDVLVGKMFRLSDVNDAWFVVSFVI